MPTKTQAKIPAQTVDNGQHKVRYSAIENELHLDFPLRYELRGRTVGALVLAKYSKSGLMADHKFKFVFGFECKGIHSTIRDKYVDDIFDHIESGLKDLPEGETLTIHFSSFSSDKERQAQLTELFQEADIPQLKFLLYGEKQRIQELTKQGIRKPKTLKLYVTYTVEPSSIGVADPVEKALKMGEAWWNQFTGQKDEVQQLFLEDLFLQGFTDGFQIWEQLLNTKMGLEVRPMTEDELWADTWKRFNKSEAPPLPQVVTLTDSGLEEVIHSEIHPTTLLIESLESCPKADRQWVKVNGKYIAAMPFVEKPAGWKDKTNQLRYLWEILSRDRVFDTEVFCEISRANEAILKTNMQRLAKQSIVSTDYAASRQSVDVAASIKTRKTIAAQEQLYEGAIPLNVATVLLVHRSTLPKLDEACRYLQSCIRRPAWIDRESEYAWRIWLQTLPVHWDALLVTPFNRRMMYLSGEAPGFMTLVRPRGGDRAGFELLSEEGGVPIHLDFFNQHRNIGVFGTTRSGKSVLISGILTQALAQGIPVVALDFPKPDGTSTFTDYTKFMGDVGAYFDIGTESNNLLEIPDLRGLSPKDQKERLEDYKGFLEGALMTMVMGDDKTPADRTVCRSLLGLAMDRYFNDLSISNRYDEAIAGGFGSRQWQTMPTLRDFLGFCTLEKLGQDGSDPKTVEMMGRIKMQLEYWLISRVGRAISSPSSFPTNARLLVFALRNLNDDADAAIMALSAYSAALRRALASPRSIFFIDESPILFAFDEISALVARLCANGAKAGVRVFLSAQDPDTIAKSPSASKILQNLTTRLVGRIQPVAVSSFVKYLDYPSDVISRNGTESFFPKKEGIYSQWLMDDMGIYTFCRFYPSYLQLAAVANNTDEQACRNGFMQLYPDDPFKALSEFANALVASLKNGTALKSPIDNRVLTPPPVQEEAIALGSGSTDGFVNPAAVRELSKAL